MPKVKEPNVVWYAIYEELNTFAQALYDADILFGEAVLAYFAKPYKYQKEYELWVKMGKPLGDEDKHWEKFIEMI